MNIQEFVNQAYAIAVNHKFHEKSRSNEHWLMLVITEISEVIDADRRGDYDGKESFIERHHVHPDFMERYKAYIKGSVAEELADICIRIFDFMGVRGISQKDVMGVYLTQEALSGCSDQYTMTEQAFELVALITHQLNEATICRIALEYCKYWAAKYHIDLEWHIRTKMLFNDNRPILHGKTY